jgi:hypothetical protein
MIRRYFTEEVEICAALSYAVAKRKEAEKAILLASGDYSEE